MLCRLILLTAALGGLSCAKADSKAPPTATLPVVTLAGSPAEIGQAHGQQLGDRIRPLHQQYIQRWLGSDAQRQQALAAAAVFESKLLPEHRLEIFALADAARADRQQTLLANCFLDLSGMVACSTLTLPAEACGDGVPRFARNLDFPSFNIADQASVVMAVRPKDRFAFVSIGWPGLVGVLSGMNEHGLTIANMEVTRDRRPPTAMPYTLLYRAVLEQCRTTEDAIALLKKTPRQTANNLMIMDAAGDRAVVENYPDRVDVRHAAADAALISTNHRRSDNPTATGRCGRYDRLTRESADQWGKLDRAALQTMLAGVQQGDMTLQSMIFEPSNRVICLSTGKYAPTRPMEKLDVKQLLSDPH